MPFQELLFVLIGIVVFVSLWFGLYRLTKGKGVIPKTTISKTVSIRGYFLFLGTLWFIAVGLFVTIKAGGTMITPELEAMAQSLIRVIWLISGMMLGALILFVIQFVWYWIKDVRANRKGEIETEIKLIAYRIWQDEGCISGYDKEYWRKAEDIWKASHKQKE